MAEIKGGIEKFVAELNIEYSKSTSYTEDNYGKTTIKDEGVLARDLVRITVTAPTLEKLQEKLVAYVGLAEL